MQRVHRLCSGVTSYHNAAPALLSTNCDTHAIASLAVFFILHHRTPAHATAVRAGACVRGAIAAALLGIVMRYAARRTWTHALCYYVPAPRSGRCATGRGLSSLASNCTPAARNGISVVTRRALSLQRGISVAHSNGNILRYGTHFMTFSWRTAIAREPMGMEHRCAARGRPPTARANLFPIPAGN